MPMISTMRRLHSSDAPAVIIVTAGNRSFESFEQWIRVNGVIKIGHALLSATIILYKNASESFLYIPILVSLIIYFTSTAFRS